MCALKLNSHILATDISSSRVIIADDIAKSQNIKNIDYKQYVVDSQLRYFKPHASNIEKSLNDIFPSPLKSATATVNGLLPFPPEEKPI